MANRKLNPTKVKYLSMGVGGRVMVETPTGYTLTDMILKSNEFNTLYIERPDGTIYARQCTNCGNMYELKTSFHKARRDDGSERYHSHCVLCRREHVKEYTEIRREKKDDELLSNIWDDSLNDYLYDCALAMEDNLNYATHMGSEVERYEAELHGDIIKLIEYANMNGERFITVPELLFRYAKGIEGIGNDVIIKDGENPEFVRYLINGLITHFDNWGKLPEIKELLADDLKKAGAKIPGEREAEVQRFDSIDELMESLQKDGYITTDNSRGKVSLSVDEVNIDITPEVGVRVNIKGVKVEIDGGNIDPFIYGDEEK